MGAAAARGGEGTGRPTGGGPSRVWGGTACGAPCQHLPAGASGLNAALSARPTPVKPRSNPGQNLFKQVDSRELLKLASDRHAVRFAPGPACLGRANEARLAFSFYSPEELRRGVARLAAALRELLGRPKGGGGPGAAGGCGPPVGLGVRAALFVLPPARVPFLEPTGYGAPWKKTACLGEADYSELPKGRCCKKGHEPKQEVHWQGQKVTSSRPEKKPKRAQKAGQLVRA